MNNQFGEFPVLVEILAGVVPPEKLTQKVKLAISCQCSEVRNKKSQSWLESLDGQSQFFFQELINGQFDKDIVRRAMTNYCQENNLDLKEARVHYSRLKSQRKSALDKIKRAERAKQNG